MCYPVIGPENLCHSLDQSDAKLSPITTWSPAFSRAFCGWLVFTLSSPIGSSGYFQSGNFYSKVYFEISLLFSSDSSIVSQPSRSEVDSPEFRVRLNVWMECADTKSDPVTVEGLLY